VITNKRKSLMVIAMTLIACSLAASISPALASSVSYVTFSPNKYSFALSEAVAAKVKASWETSNVVGFGWIQYTIKIKESIFFGLWTKDVASSTYKEVSYFGKMPNPIQIEKTLYIPASTIGRGNHILFAEVSFAKSSVPIIGIISWDTKTSSTTNIVVN
jgi:hypothetical protein